MTQVIQPQKASAGTQEGIVLLPHSDDAERAILASILLNNGLLGRIEGILRPHEFFRDLHQKTYLAMCRLATRGSVIDPITLSNELQRTGDIDSNRGPAWITGLLDGFPKSDNVTHYVRIVKEAARRRAIIQINQRMQDAAQDGISQEGLEVFFEQLEAIRGDDSVVWKPSTLAGVANPDAGTVPYVVEGLLPEGEVTLAGATWKSGKTLLAYRLMLDILTGKPAFGHFPVREPLPVVVFQLEMPSWEDDRRFRRLALGDGIRPEDIPRYVAEGHLTVFNRPPLSLTTAEGARAFHRTVRLSGARVVLLDSLIAAFAGANLNDNSIVRELFSRAFGPLTSEGVTVFAQHHRRKRQAVGAKSEEDDHSALLGAQAFGAAAGRVYALERLRTDGDSEEGRRGFKARLSLTGSWTPEDAEEVILSVSDTEDGGTTVRVLTEAEQIAKGGITTPQRAALELVRIVKEEPGISRRKAFSDAGAALDLGEGSLKKGLTYARKMNWVLAQAGEGRKNNAMVLLPGSVQEDEL